VGGIQNVTWTNSTIAASGAAVGTLNWSANIPVQLGPNAIAVTATNVVGIASAATLTFIVDPEVAGWGSNSDGKLGTGTRVDASYPVASAISGVAKVSAGVRHSLSLMTDGTVRGWGGNYTGDLGTVFPTFSTSPITVPGLSDVKDLDAGNDNSLAVTNGGAVYAWGSRYTSTPTPIPGLTGVQAIANGPVHAVALLGDQTVRNVYGTVLEDPGLAGVTAVSAGSSYSVALLIDGTLWVWGASTVNPPTLPTTPVQIPLSGVVTLGRGGTSAITGDGKVWTWGVSAGVTSTPTQNPLPDGILAVDEKDSAGVALRSDGTVWTWGRILWYSNNQQISSIQFNPYPSAVPSVTNAKSVSQGTGFRLISRTP
jgi:alpha-tubulin suppressor-like RCC1 family protein